MSPWFPLSYPCEFVIRIGMTALSGLLALVMRNGALGRLFGGYFGMEGQLVAFDSGQVGGFGGGRRRPTACMAICRQNEALKNLMLKQWLTRMLQSHLRVICATPTQKQPHT